MTVGAVSNMGYGVMGRYNGYNDPYFMQAYNSPNSNYQLAQQQAQMAQQAQAASQAQSQSVAPTQTSPSFQGGASDAIQAEAQEEGSSIGKWILGIGSLAALAWGGFKCFKKGNGEGLAKLWDGAKQYWDDGCKWVKGLFGKSTDKADDIAETVNNRIASGTVGELMPTGSPRTAEFKQAVEECQVGFANDIVENMQRVDEATNPLNHMYNQRKYEALWGEKATT